MGGLGGFGALFDLSGKYREPVLVSGTDGVGTKLKLAQQLDRHDTIGIDLVAMCVNDVLVQGAEPLFFLDYFATGKLDVDTTVAVVGGIAQGCELAGCALIGGETAEMPDMYPPGEYDLAGFSVGAVEKSKLLDGSKVRAGDVLIGIASSGPHSNGYSLVRRIFDRAGRPADLDVGGVTLDRRADGADRALREAGAGTAAASTTLPRDGAHHRRRPDREHHPRGARRPGPARSKPRRSCCRRCSTGCSAKARCARRGDVAHVQLRHRLRAGGARRRRRGRRAPTSTASAWRTARIGEVVRGARRRTRADRLTRVRSAIPHDSAPAHRRARLRPRQQPAGAARRDRRRRARRRDRRRVLRSARRAWRCNARARRHCAGSRDADAHSRRARRSTPRSSTRSTRGAPDWSSAPATCACSATRSSRASAAACSTSIRRCCRRSRPAHPRARARRRRDANTAPACIS